MIPLLPANLEEPNLSQLLWSGDFLKGFPIQVLSYISRDLGAQPQAAEQLEVF